MDNPDVVEECLELQQSEIFALESIFPDCIISKDTTARSIQLQTNIVFGEPRSLLITPLEVQVDVDVELGSTISSFEHDMHNPRITALPPITLSLTLPSTYPLLSPPHISGIQSQYDWFNDTPSTSTLKGKLLSMWDNGDNILYTWIEYIQTGDFLRDMGYFIDVDTPTIRLPHLTPTTLLPLLKSHAITTSTNTFAQTTYTCSICISSLKGSKCVQLDCEYNQDLDGAGEKSPGGEHDGGDSNSKEHKTKHVFCEMCLKEYWSMCIREGIVELGCPGEECVRGKAKPRNINSGAGENSNYKSSTKKRVVGEDELKRVLDPLELERWKWLVRKRETDRDPTITYCPFKGCESPVRFKPTNRRPNVNSTPTLTPNHKRNASDATGWDRLRECEECGYVFCVACKNTWHGPVFDCQKSKKEEEEDIDGITHARDRELGWKMKKKNQRYQRIVVVDDSETKATVYPGCRMGVVKEEGCNYIICSLCDTHFCYVCGNEMDDRMPVIHSLCA